MATPESVPAVPPAPPHDPATFFNLDFDIMREGWSVYELEDGNKLRVRMFLTQLRGPSIPPQKGENITFEVSQAIKIDTPPNRRGPKGTPATMDEITNPLNHGGVEISIRNSNEPWNEYHVLNTSIRVRIKAVVSRVL